MRLSEVQRGVRSRVARFVAPKSDAITATQGYYAQQPSCQIPYLHHLYSRFLGDRADGVFVEVGAYDGVFVSNTWGLAERGWLVAWAEERGLRWTIEHDIFAAYA